MKWPEKLLHFIWRYKLFNQKNLKTTQNEILRILDFGQYNSNAGADFEFAKIQINDKVWFGNIELHLNSVHWTHHQHHLDPNYNSTILHVVWEDPTDIHIQRLDGSTIPTLILKDIVDEKLLYNYQHLMENAQWISCQNKLDKVPTLTITSWLDRLIVERLETRCELINQWIALVNGDWEHVQLVALGRAFGMKVNSDSFENFILRLNPNILYKYVYDSTKLEALLFGSAGFLSKIKNADSYANQLYEEYKYLKQLHNLYELSSVEWKFLRMRPYNFPTFRLAQLCALLMKRIKWFELVRSSTLDEVFNEFDTIETSSYWQNHFHFNKLSKRHETKLTKQFIQHVVLNAFIPVLFAYGKYTGQQDLQQKALDWLQLLPVENNSILKAYNVHGIKVNSASESQALLHLFKQYCTPKKCLDCAIGHSVLSR